jgi:integrase
MTFDIYNLPLNIDEATKVLVDADIATSKKPSLCDKTIKSYTEWWRPYVKFCRLLSFSPSVRDAAIQYLDWMVSKRLHFGYASNVRNKMQRVYGFIPPLPKMSKYVLKDDVRTNTERILSSYKLERIRKWAEGTQNNIRGDTQLAELILFMLYTFIRPFEALSLTSENVRQLMNDGKTVLLGKGPRLRTVFSPTTNDTKDFYATVLSRARYLPADKPILQYSDRHFRRLFKILQKQVLSLPPPYPMLHSLRRGSARALWEKTRDIFAVKECLGHKILKSTYTYLEISEDDLIAKLNKANE